MPFALLHDALPSVCNPLLFEWEHSRLLSSRCALGECTKCLPTPAVVNLSVGCKNAVFFSFFCNHIFEKNKKQLLYVNVFDICQDVRGKVLGSDQLKSESLTSESKGKQGNFKKNKGNLLILSSAAPSVCVSHPVSRMAAPPSGPLLPSQPHPRLSSGWTTAAPPPVGQALQLSLVTLKASVKSLAEGETLRFSWQLENKPYGYGSWPFCLGAQEGACVVTSALPTSFPP